MSIVTAGDLIFLAFRTSGITGQGQTPAAEDATDGMSMLNMMIGQWQKRRWLVWADVDTAVVSTGAASYTVGPSMNFNIATPDKIEAAFCRILGTTGNPLDLALGIIESREDYYGIALKSLSTVPIAVFYESLWPTGVLRFWPIPPASLYELHIATKVTLPVYVNLSDPLNLPGEYIEAALYSLVVRLSMNYGQQPNPGHAGAMREALNVLRMANTQVAQLSMPAGVTGRRGSSVSADQSPAFQSGWW